MLFQIISHDNILVAQGRDEVLRAYEETALLKENIQHLQSVEKIKSSQRQLEIASLKRRLSKQQQIIKSYQNTTEQTNLSKTSPLQVPASVLNDSGTGSLAGADLNQIQKAINTITKQINTLLARSLSTSVLQYQQKFQQLSNDYNASLKNSSSNNNSNDSNDKTLALNLLKDYWSLLENINTVKEEQLENSLPENLKYSLESNDNIDKFKNKPLQFYRIGMDYGYIKTIDDEYFEVFFNTDSPLNNATIRPIKNEHIKPMVVAFFNLDERSNSNQAMLLAMPLSQQALKAMTNKKTSKKTSDNK